MISFIVGRLIEFFIIWTLIIALLFAVIYSYILWTKVKGREVTQ